MARGSPNVWGSIQITKSYGLSQPPHNIIKHTNLLWVRIDDSLAFDSIGFLSYYGCG